jgi:hypothetical protein
VHLVGANVSTTQPLVPGTPIELAFDRLLLPSSVTRQAFAMQDLMGNYLQPVPSYDPVSRVVRLCISGLQPDQSYRITIVSPGDAADTNGLRAIDGALFDPTQNNVVEFPVARGPAYTGVDACQAPSLVDFCKDVLPIFANKCTLVTCHGGSAGSLPAAGLLLTTPAGIRETAINRVAQGSNTGTRSTAQPGSRPYFGVDMPIIDSANAPGNSWLVYKLLLAAPACSVQPTTCDAGAPAPTQRLAYKPWSPLADSERATLSDWIPGREMPYPVDPSVVPGTTNDPLTVDEMQTVSLWILQGAAVPDCAP